MSDHPKVAERDLKRIHICDDIYFDVFYALPLEKLGFELALVSDKFDYLVDTHFKSRKRTLRDLTIYSNEIIRRRWTGKLSCEHLPFPQVPLPSSIIGFSYIEIRSTNHNVNAFLQRIGRLLESDIRLSIQNWEHDWTDFITSIWSLLNVSAIVEMCFSTPYDFRLFRCRTSPSILRDCFNLRRLMLLNGQFLEFPPDDNDGSSDGQALCKWLHTPRADGQPNILEYDLSESEFDALKTAFLNATTSVTFVIRLFFHLADAFVVPFELANSLTHEQMTYQTVKIGNVENRCFVVRCPADKDAKQLVKELVGYAQKSICCWY